MHRFRFLSTVIDAVESKTRWTANHSKRVGWLSTTIGTFLGFDDTRRRDLALAAHLHDIGKIGISDTLLDKPSRITPRELAHIRTHPLIGSDMFNSFFLDLLDFGFDVHEADVPVNDIMTVIRHHHERIDGNGYPDGLAGLEISEFARIVCVADAVDSMMSDRPYRLGQGIDYAMSELRRHRGTQFDPLMVDAFIENFSPDLLTTLHDVLNNAYPSL